MVGFKFKDICYVFIMYQYFDYNVDYGMLMLLVWVIDLIGFVDVWGLFLLVVMMIKFFELYDYDICICIVDEGCLLLVLMFYLYELIEGGLVMQDVNVKVMSVLVKYLLVLLVFVFCFDLVDCFIVIFGDMVLSENFVCLVYGVDVFVYEVMYLLLLDKLLFMELNVKMLCEYLLVSYIFIEEVGCIVIEVKVKMLVLLYFVFGGYLFLEDLVWFDVVCFYFKGEIIVGYDLQEI